MDKVIADTLDEIDAYVALGEYIRRANAAATGDPYSPATEVIAGKISELYAGIFFSLADKADAVVEAAADTHRAVVDNIKMGRQIYAAAQQGLIPPDKAGTILNFLINDSEKKATDLEATYG